MKPKTLKALAAALFLALLLLIGAKAMSSANYSLDWFVPLSGAGGGKSSSPSYAADFTIGQSAVGPSSGTSYKVGLGYWSGVDQNTVFLPIIFK